MAKCQVHLVLAVLASLSVLAFSGYGNVGGPIAKSPRKKTPQETRTPNPIPDVDNNVPDVSLKEENSKIDAEMVKNPNVNIPAVNEKSLYFPSKPGEYGDICCWEPYNNQILGDIYQGKSAKPFYGLISIESCGDPASCVQKCDQTRCNVAIWNNANRSATFYVVHKDRMSEVAPLANLTKLDGTDTLVRRCLRVYDVSSTCSELVPTYCPTCDEFLDFVQKHQQTYKGCEFLRRFEIFKVNKRKISAMNERRVLDDDATFTMTKFSDKTFEEFQKSFTGGRPDTGLDVQGDNIEKDKYINASGSQELLLRFDWRDKGVISEPRDQDDCGSCYAFSSTDMVAAQYLIDRREFGKSYTLAPQYILDCFKDPAAFGCDGGRPAMVMNALSKCSNLSAGTESPGCEFPLETCMPYKKDATSICDKPRCPGAPRIKVEKFGLIEMAGDYLEKQKMAGLLHRGPLVVQIDANDAWQFYESGILRAHQCSTKINHAVLVVGYDFGVGVPAYIVKNSWGPDWGKQGYIYLEAGVNACGVGQAVTYACTAYCDVEPAPQPQVTQQYQLPPTSPFPYGQPTIAPAV